MNVNCNKCTTSPCQKVMHRGGQFLRVTGFIGNIP